VAPPTVRFGLLAPLPLLAVSLAAVVLVGACAGDADEPAGGVPTEDGARFEVAPGEAFVVALASNPSTGYAWALEEAPPAGVVVLEDRELVAGPTDRVGAAGVERFTFRAVGVGEATVRLWYVRSFDDPPAPADRASFPVVVGAGPRPPGG
jgi:inhibitor of cysteine peptidase